MRKLPTDSVLDSFMKKVRVDPDTECWEWIAAYNEAGYGVFWDGQSVGLAHRFSYKERNGTCPNTLDHKCRNRRCVNPEHLRPMSRGDNVMIGDTIAARNKAKTHCKRGHPLTQENCRASLWPKHRVCRICYNAAKNECRYRRGTRKRPAC